MPGRKKKFIDKKHAVTFTLVHRSQKDPEAANEEAPQRVLLAGSQREEQLKYGIDFEDDYNYLQHLKDVDELYQVEAGTFRIGKRSSDVLMEVPIQDKPKLLLPSSVFGSTSETSVGLLNKAAPLPGPHPELDPDILAALDGEVGSDEEMEDDFIMKANSNDIITEENEEYDDEKEEEEEDDDDDDDDDDTIGSENEDNGVKHMDKNKFDRIFKNITVPGNEVEEEDDDDDDIRGGRSDDDDDDVDDAISRFTGCSMTSSVIRRNDNLQMIDEKFDQFYKQFKKDNIDEEDDDDDDMDNFCDDHPTSEAFKHLVDQFTDVSKQKVIKMKDFVMNEKTDKPTQQIVADTNKSNKEDDNEEEDGSDDDDDSVNDKCDELEEISIEKPSKDWDCETIISTYSTTSNLPKTLTLPKTAKIKLTKRVQIPADVLPPTGPTRKQTEENTHTYTKPIVLERDKEESKEEKKARKNAVKNNRRVRRMEKAAMKELFKDEKLKRKLQYLNQQVNFQGASLLS